MDNRKPMDTSQRVGITESGDPAFHLEIFDCLYPANIIITKRLTDKLIEKLLEHCDKCILHCTCTGYGGTVLEPLVPAWEQTKTKLTQLIEKGFPVKQIVLRVDPIIPTQKGIELAKNVVNSFSELGIKRVRVSIIDMYDHVKTRFLEHRLPFPQQQFHAPYEVRKSIIDELSKIGETLGYELEVCGEPGIESTSCLSQKDIDILGMTNEIHLKGGKGQRFDCNCPRNKSELIRRKPASCPNGCLYCFWKG